MTPVSEKFFFVRGSLNLFELQTKCKKLTPIQKMSSSQSCSHRNSVQNAPIESSTALTATLFVKNLKFDPDPKKCWPASQSCSHRNSVQNAPVEGSTALTATLFVKNRKNDVITKLFAPKFCAECTGRELHSSHGDPFRELFDFRAN